MQVDALSNSFLALTGGQSRISGAQRRERLATRAADNASRDPSQQRQAAVPTSGRVRAAQPARTSAANRGADTASISPTAKSANLQSTDGSQSTPATTGGRITAGGAIVERYVRQRAVLAYQSPTTKFGSYNLTLEVESSYRVIEYIPPGGTIDVEG